MFTTFLICSLTLGQTSTPMPPLKFARWLNTSHPVKYEDYRGKIVVIHTAPGFCCGYDYTARFLKKLLDRYPSKLAVIGVSYTKFDEEQQGLWNEIKGQLKVNWPIGLDEDESFTAKFFPGGEAIRWSYIFINRKGERLPITLHAITEVEEIVKKLVESR